MAEEQLIRIALDMRFVTAEAVAEARTRQRELDGRGIDRSVWLLLQDLGHLSAEHAIQVQACTSSMAQTALEVEGYVVQSRLGQGGMGDVFLGQRPDGTEVAIKLLPTHLCAQAENLGRFKREVEALAHLEHPHITRFLGSGEVQGRPYLLMELVHGRSLKDQLMAQGAINQREALVLLRQMAEALQTAWRNGLVHRDVKPGNILLGSGRPGLDEPFCAKLCDFGLVKFRLSDAEHPELTQQGIAVGTPHYMSPEQAAGDNSPDARHDIYGLGATIYHALLGRTLYSGRSSVTIMFKQATAKLDMRPLSDLAIDPRLVELIEGMLAKPRDHRWPDWETVLQRLELIERRLNPTPADPVSSSRGQASRMAWFVLLVLLFVAGLVWWCLRP